MVESNPKFYTGGDGFAHPVWSNPAKTTPEESMEEGSTLWDAIILIGAAGFVVFAFLIVCWVFAIAEALI